LRKVLAAVVCLSIIPAVATAQDDAGEWRAQHDHGAHAPAVTPAADPPPAARDAPATVSAESGTQVRVNATPEERQRRDGFNWGVGLSQQMGQSTFKAAVDTENAEMLMDLKSALSLNGSYGFTAAGVRLSASTGGNVSYELSTPNNVRGRRFFWSDLRFGLAAPGIYKESVTGITVSPSLNLSAPISEVSQWQNVITASSVGVTLARGFGKVNTRLSLGASKTFFYRDGPGYSADKASTIRDQNQVQLYLCRADDVHCFGGLNPNYSLSSGLGVSWAPMEKLSLAMNFGLSKSVKPTQPIDEYSSQATFDGTSDPVVVATGSSDMMTGSLSASWAFNRQVGLALSMNTAQKPFYEGESKGLRFPFYGFEGQERSATSFSLALSSSF
jgi:hypothetical protein